MNGVNISDEKTASCNSGYLYKNRMLDVYANVCHTGTAEL